MRKRVSYKPKMAGSWNTRQFSDGNKVRTAYLQQIFLTFQVYIPLHCWIRNDTCQIFKVLRVENGFYLL